MPKDEPTSLAEKRWKEGAESRAKKAAEKVALLIDSYYHLKIKIEDNQGDVAATATEKKRREDNLAALHKQLEGIEMQIRKKHGVFARDFEETAAIDHMAKQALNTEPEKSPERKSATIHQFKAPKKG